MIRVTKIVGETLDLETGGGSSKSLVLTNGSREVLVPVDEEVLKLVLQLVAEDSESPFRKGEVLGPMEDLEEQQSPQLVPESPVPKSRRVRKMKRPVATDFDDADPGEVYSVSEVSSV